MSPLSRALFLSALSLSCAIADLRFHYLEPLRQALMVAAYPLVSAVSLPAEWGRNLGDNIASLSELQAQNSALRAKALDAARRLPRMDALEQENMRLRALVDLKGRVPARSQVAEILYFSKDPFVRRVILDKGSRQGIEAGQAVMDETGVIGQVTRIFPLQAEVTLLTDRDQAIPVMVVRNGLRAVLFGSSQGMTELRFLAVNADVQAGDRLVTSGLDGVFLPGLPVATVLRVERESGGGFARIPCQPTGGVERYGLVLVIGRAEPAPPRPPEPETVTAPTKGKKTRASKQGGN
jgi:rod shape-determining protein MreC